MLPYLFMVFVFGFASATQYEQSFFPQNARRQLNDLKRFGTWIQECNGNPNEALLHFPIEEIPSVCDSLELLGFSENTPGNCSRIPLICNQTQDKIQWTNLRKKDHFNVDFDSDILEVETTFSKNGFVTLKAGPGEVIQITKILNKCFYNLRERYVITRNPCPSAKDVFTFGFLKTKTAVYEYRPKFREHLYDFTKLYLPINISQLEFIQDEANSSLTKMNHSQTESVTRHPNELDNLHRISNQLKDHNIWNCDLLNDCQELSFPTSGRLNITNALIPKTKIYFHFHLQSNLNLIIIQGNGQSHLMRFVTDKTKTHLYVPDKVSFEFGWDEVKREVVLVVLPQSVMFMFIHVLEGAVVHELFFDKLIIEHIQSFQIEPIDNQMTKTILISSPIEAKLNDLNPKSGPFSISFMLFAPLVPIVLICLLISFYLLKRSKGSRNTVIIRPQDTTRSSGSGNEDIQSNPEFISREDCNNGEDYYNTSNIDYYSTSNMDYYNTSNIG